MYQANIAEKRLGVLHAYKVKCCNFAFLQRRPVRRISDIAMMISIEKAGWGMVHLSEDGEMRREMLGRIPACKPAYHRGP